MKNCGCFNVSKQRNIKNGEKHINLDIFLHFGSLDNMKITSSEPKEYFGISGKMLITSLSLKTIRRPKKSKKSRYGINNVSLKGISKIIKEFEKLSYEVCVPKRSKHESTES